MSDSIPAIGSRAQVWHGTAKHTPGGLVKRDLKRNKHGRIVSRKQSMAAKKEKRLERAGYFTKKHQFGAIYRGPSQSKTRSRRGRRGRGRRGG